MDYVTAVIELEKRLLDPSVRADPHTVDKLLAPDFSEIGRSGRQWSRAEMLQALATNRRTDEGWQMLFHRGTRDTG